MLTPLTIAGSSLRWWSRRLTQVLSVLERNDPKTFVFAFGLHLRSKSGVPKHVFWEEGPNWRHLKEVAI